MKRLAALLILLLCAGCAPAKATEDQFRHDMIERFRKQQPQVKFEIGDEPLVVSVDGGADASGTLNLHRIFQYCQNASAGDCEAAKKEFVEKSSTKPPPLTSASLRIVVRDAVYVDYIGQLEAKAGNRQAIRRQIGDDLFAILVSDGPNTIALVGDTSLAELKLSEAAAWDIGWRQTQSILPKIPFAADLEKSAAAFESEEYLASLAADLPAWQKISDALGDDLFLTAVSDQFVFAGVMPDGPDFEAFRKSVAEDCRAQQRCVSPNLYRFRKGRWVVAP
jgi:hypothetical protein